MTKTQNKPENSNVFWKIVNEADESEAELLLYGEISDTTWFGDEVTPKQFAEDLKALEGKDLTLRVNSPGGDVFAAQAMYNLLKAYSGNITARIDGIAASAATIVTCAADKVIMPNNGIYMIHNPACVVWAVMDVPKLEKLAGELAKSKNTILNVYSKRCKNLSEEELSKMMDEETWMDADEALNYGFIDEVDSDEAIENSLNGSIAIVNNIKVDTARYSKPDKLKNILEKKESKGMEEKNLLEKIKDLLDGAFAPQNQAQEEDPVAVERQRMLDLDAMRDGSEIIDKIVDIAKRNGNTAEEIQEYVDQVKAVGVETSQQAGIEEIKNLVKDQMGSGAQNIVTNAVESHKGQTEEQDQAAEIANLANAMKNLRGEE